MNTRRAGTREGRGREDGREHARGEFVGIHSRADMRERERDDVRSEGRGSEGVWVMHVRASAPRARTYATHPEAGGRAGWRVREYTAHAVAHARMRV